MKEQAKQTGKFTKGSNKILILTGIQYICKENKVSLCEQNIQVINRKTEEAPEKTQLTINYLFLQAQKLTQVNSKQQSPDDIITSFFLCV